MSKIVKKRAAKKSTRKSSSAPAAAKPAPGKGTKRKSSPDRQKGEQFDGETRDDVLLDQEAISVDEITENTAPAKADVAPTSVPTKTDGVQKEGTRAKRQGAEANADKKSDKEKKGKGNQRFSNGDVGQVKQKKLKTKDYLDLITPLHVELLKFQNWVKEERLRIVALFEGRDAAGKGGTIKRFIEHMNPRGCRVVALDKPTDEERNQWYFQRYVRHLPTAGEIVLFDRSWYNRAMVERVMGFCTGEEVQEFVRSVPEFERMLIRSGITMFKFYFSVSKKEQARRFHNRIHDPLRQWKLSPVDREGQGKWDEYTQAKEDLFFYTSTSDCPWTIIKSDDKKRARLNAIRFFLQQFDYPDRRKDILEVDPQIIRTVDEELLVED